jgi:hypothetical protein
VSWHRAPALACPAGVCDWEGTARFPWACSPVTGSSMSRYGIARPLSRLALCGVVFAPSFRRVSQCRWVGVKAMPHRAERGLALTQEPCGITVRSLCWEEAQDGSAEPPRAAKPLTSRSAAIRKASLGGRGGRGSSGTSRAQRRRCLPCVPPGGQRGEARCSGCSSALPSRQGAGTRPGSPVARGGSPAATPSQPLHGPVRGRLRRQAYRCDGSCANHGRRLQRSAIG